MSDPALAALNSSPCPTRPIDSPAESEPPVTSPSTPIPTNPSLPGWWVVIVAYNDPQLVDQCVKSYCTQSRVPETILVVDNSDVALTPDELSSEVILIHSTEAEDRNTGSAGGFAAGLEYAFGRGAAVVVLSDQDFLPSPTLLEELAASHFSYPTAVISSLTVDPASQEVMPSWLAKPRSPERAKPLDPNTYEFWLAPNRHELASALGYEVSTSRFPNIKELRKFADEHPGIARAPLVSPHGLVIPRKVFQSAGGFRRSFFIGLDDYDYSARLLDLEVPILVCLTAVGYHHLCWNHDRRIIGRSVKVFHGSPSSMGWAIRNSLIMARERARGRLFTRWILHEAYRSCIFVLLGDGPLRPRVSFVVKGWSAGLRSSVSRGRNR